MAGLTSSMLMAAHSLLVQQAALSTTSNNIANANTPGYSREVVNMVDADPLQEGSLWFGTGVSIDNVSSIRDRLLQLRIYDATQREGNTSAQLDSLKEIENLFSDATTGIGADLTAFFNSLNELSTDPSSGPSRQGVLTAAGNLASSFQNAVSQLNTVRNNLNLSVTGSVNQINQLTEQIAGLNAQIGPIQRLGQDAGALEDQRDELIRQLSEVVDVLAIPTDEGETLTTSGGAPLVVGGASFELVTSPDVGGIQHVYSQGSDITSNLHGGKLGGLLTIRDQEVPSVLSSLDALAGELATNVNAALKAGYDLNGHKGVALFAPNAPGAGAAASMAVLITDPNLIAASSDGSVGSNGNLTNVLAVQNQKLSNGQTPIDSYSSLVFQIGNTGSQAKADNDANGVLLQQLLNQRSAISGVSIDEETTNLLRYQHAYQAAAQVISTVDELTQLTIDMVK